MDKMFSDGPLLATTARTDEPDRVWEAMLRRPLLTLGLVSLLVVLAAAGLGNVRKDPSVDAFVPGDHPAAIARDNARALFGLEDPLIIGLAVPAGESAFQPAILDAVRTIGNQLAGVPNVDKNGIMSVATENAIRGSKDLLSVDPILEPGPVTSVSAALAAERLATMPMFSGLLAADTGDMLTLIVPVDDPNAAEETYLSVRRIAEQAAPPGVAVSVAGVAAMNGRLARMVSEDTRLFVPAAIVTALLFLLVALKRPRALLGPFYVIVGSCAVAIGTMGWLDARYYLITTALPVIVMAIAIADSLHISVTYLRETAAQRGLDRHAGIALALRRTFLPVTLTSLTTIAGFTGLALGSPMRPISEFGVFAAVGVGAAWLLSITALPAIMVLTGLVPRPAARSEREPLVDRGFRRITEAAFRRPLVTTASIVVLLVVFGVLAGFAEFDYERKRYFTAADPVRIADVTMNERLRGTNFLDMVVSSDEPEGLMRPASIRALSDLKRELVLQPFVGHVSGLDDYIATMHQVLTGAPAGTLPTREHAPAQYFLLYEASGDPGDFDAVVDYDYQHALVRTQLTTDRYSRTARVVDEFREIAERFSADTGLTATVSGRIAVNEGWMSLLASSHFVGLGLAAAFVLIAAMLAFRSIADALLAFIPVGSGVLMTYACMGALGIDIAPATSMTAAIATGLGVDFGIHLVSRFRKARREGADFATALSGPYVTVGRACCFSALALAVALSVVCLSSAPPLRWFGVLVAAAVVGSLLGAVLFLPAVFGLKARFSPALAANETETHA